MRTPTDLGLWLVEEAQRRGFIFRLLGGAAVEGRCRDIWAKYPPLRRAPADVDLAGYSTEEASMIALFRTVGAREAREFNYLNSGQRLMYEIDGIKIDVMLDNFVMSHAWSMRGRLELDPMTLPYEDLLLTKLQVARPAEKDIQDTVTLLLARESWQDPSGLDGFVCIVDLCAKDWGLWRTVMDNLDRCEKQMIHYIDATGQARVARTTQDIRKGLDGMPKRISWRLRSLWGRRFAWYEVPDEPQASFE